MVLLYITLFSGAFLCAVIVVVPCISADVEATIVQDKSFVASWRNDDGAGALTVIVIGVVCAGSKMVGLN